MARRYSSNRTVSTDEAGITAYVPRPSTSNNKAKGLSDKADFHDIAQDDDYQCPVGNGVLPI
jgi:hypothetical protein